AGHGPAGQRGVQAPPRRRADRARPASGRGPRRRPGRGALMQVTMTVNGVEVTREIEARLLLVHFLRDELALTGTHWGCDTSNCGACVVWLHGAPGKSCHVRAPIAAG